jgi:hypothetical protein
LVEITCNDLYMQQIIKHLFKADTLEEVSRQRLEELVEEYPSFGVARYLLSRKLGAENADHFTEETQKTNLYFTNPFWLHWLLEEAASVKGWGPKAEVAEGIVEKDHPTNGHSPLIATGEVVELDELPPWAEETVEQPAEEPKVEEKAEQDVPIEEVQIEEAQVEEAQPVEEVRIEEKAPVEEVQIDEAQVEELQVEEAQVEEAQVEEAQVEEAHTEEPSSEEIKAEVAPIEEASVEVPVEAPVEVPTEVPMESPTEVPAAVEPELIFQSFHTVDYFASQGIKFSAEENPSDRLGKQLKSFTAWLKVMKRLPQKPGEPGESAPDIISEHKIQAIAAHSVEGREVVTETMAEVLEKQGMWEKAADVYHKLSLLNPDKSSYFAAKIREIQTRADNSGSTN